MIVAGLAANTAAALLQQLQGKKHGATPDTRGHAAEQFGAKLESLIPGAAAAGQALDALGAAGQDALNRLGIGANAPASSAQPAQAARAYTSGASLP